MPSGGRLLRSSKVLAHLAFAHRLALKKATVKETVAFHRFPSAK